MNLRSDAGAGESARPPRASVLAVAAMLAATLAGAIITDRVTVRSHNRDEQRRGVAATARVQDAAKDVLHATSSLAGVVGQARGGPKFTRLARLILQGKGVAAVHIATVAPAQLAAVTRAIGVRSSRLRPTRMGATLVYDIVLSSFQAPTLSAGGDAAATPSLRSALGAAGATQKATVAASPGGVWVVKNTVKSPVPMTSGFVAVFYPTPALLQGDAGRLGVSVDGSPLDPRAPRSGGGGSFSEGFASWRVFVPAQNRTVVDRLLPVGVLIVGSAFALLVWTALGRVLRRQTAALTLERRRSERRVLAERVADEERRRIARDLHDSISQGLFSMQLQARTAAVALERDGVKKDSPLWRSVHEMGRLTRSALAEIRALIFELRPEGLREEGLVAALDKHAAAVAARHDLRVEVDLPADPLPLDPLVEEELYRLAQEAIHNAVRHSNADCVKVSAGADPVRGVWLEVADDGVGFDPTIQRPGHLGLRTMAERAARAGGDLVIDSQPGAGTRVRLSLPLVTA